jgi:hypothetical protein
LVLFSPSAALCDNEVREDPSEARGIRGDGSRPPMRMQDVIIIT